VLTVVVAGGSSRVPGLYKFNGETSSIDYSFVRGGVLNFSATRQIFERKTKWKM
jgi:hypothetical protein